MWPWPSGLAVLLLAALTACGGSSSTGAAGVRVKFVNRWYAVSGSSELRVTIDACQQEFALAPGEERIVDCQPGGGLSSFLVRIEGRITGLSYIGDQPDVWEGQVGQGQTVTITGQINQIAVAVED